MARLAVTLADFMVALAKLPGPWSLTKYGAIVPDPLTAVLGPPAYEWAAKADARGLRRLDAWALIEAGENRYYHDAVLRAQLLAATVKR